MSLPGYEAILSPPWASKAVQLWLLYYTYLSLVITHFSHKIQLSPKLDVDIITLDLEARLYLSVISAWGIASPLARMGRGAKAPPSLPLGHLVYIISLILWHTICWYCRLTGICPLGLWPSESIPLTSFTSGWFITDVHILAILYVVSMAT